MIELSQGQVNQVVQEATDAGGLPLLLSGLSGVDETLAAAREAENMRVSQSLLQGLLVLASFPADGDLAVTEAARGLGMSASTCHRYITTLLSVGLLRQDPGTRRYMLVK